MSNEENYPEGVKVRSLYKAVKLLDYFNSAHPERGISELAELSGMLKSSVYNIMSTFESCGVVEKNPKTSQYRLGLKILEWSNALSQNDVFGRVIRPFLEELTDRTGETVFLATLTEQTSFIWRRLFQRARCRCDRSRALWRQCTAPVLEKRFFPAWSHL